MNSNKSMKRLFTRENFATFNIISIAYLCMFYGVLAHTIYATVYFLTGFYTLGIHSVCATILYLVSISLFNEHRIRNMFIVINLELLSFIVVNALTFDWGFSFDLYVFVIIPLIMISCSSHSTNKYNLKLAVIQFSILTLTILATKIVTAYNGYDATKTLTNLYAKIYDLVSVFNFASAILCAFILLLAFTNDLNKTRDALIHASTHDPLTNLINRGGMQNNFDNALSKSELDISDYSIIIADLDNFKRINDTYGHNAGDDVLKTVASTFLNTVDSTDYVCRWGGEEILVLTPHNIEHTKKLAENLRSTIEKTVIQSGELNINITATFGISQFAKGLSLSDIISKADNNLYIGKNSTKNCVIV